MKDVADSIQAGTKKDQCISQEYMAGSQSTCVLLICYYQQNNGSNANGCTNEVPSSVFGSQEEPGEQQNTWQDTFPSVLGSFEHRPRTGCATIFTADNRVLGTEASLPPHREDLEHI